MFSDISLLVRLRMLTTSSGSLFPFLIATDLGFSTARTFTSSQNFGFRQQISGCCFERVGRGRDGQEVMIDQLRLYDQDGRVERERERMCSSSVRIFDCQ